MFLMCVFVRMRGGEEGARAASLTHAAPCRLSHARAPVCRLCPPCRAGYVMVGIMNVILMFPVSAVSDSSRRRSHEAAQGTGKEVAGREVV